MGDSKFIFFDFEVFKNYWCCVANIGEDWHVIEDINKLKDFYNEHKNKLWVGYNNYKYDDHLLVKLLTKKTISFKALFNFSDGLISRTTDGTGWKLRKRSLDVTQEFAPEDSSGFPPSLKKIEFGLGWDIEETPVDFTQPLPKEKISEVIAYCKHDVRATKEVFFQRKAYFKGKLNLIRYFKLAKNPVTLWSKTRATLSSKALTADPDTIVPVSKDDFLKVESKILPKNILDYYRNYINLIDEEKGIVKRDKPLNIKYLDIHTTLSGGGLHGVAPGELDYDKVKFGMSNIVAFADDKWLLVDVDGSSYYSSKIAENNWYSRKCRTPERLNMIYENKSKLKKEGDFEGSNIQKIVLNAYYGSLGGMFTDLYDPVHALNVCVSGQLSLLELATLLYNEFQVKFVQFNTDGIMFKIRKKHLKQAEKLVAKYGKHIGCKFDWEFYKWIYQDNVNNYILCDTDGKLKGKGSYKAINQKDGIIVDVMSGASIKGAQTNNYMIKRAIQDLTDYEFEYDPLDYFQMVAGTKSSIIYYIENATPTIGKSGRPLKNQYTGELTELQKINRIYASIQEPRGFICNRKGNIKKNTPQNARLHNQKVTGLPKDLDYAWYNEQARQFYDKLRCYKEV